MFVVALTLSFAVLDVIFTTSLVTGLPLASRSVAVAVLKEVPLATIDAGFSDRVMLDAGAGVSVNVVGGDTTFGVTELSVAMIVGVPATFELVSVDV